eukprot:Clim_evm29s230 gene=Clim_evmTU29s230
MAEFFADLPGGSLEDGEVMPYGSLHKQAPDVGTPKSAAKIAYAALCDEIPDLGRNEIFLDLGCGTGDFLEHVLNQMNDPSSKEQKMLCQLQGMDNQRSLLTAAEKRFAGKNVIFKHCDAFKPMTFDGSVVCIYMFMVDRFINHAQVQKSLRAFLASSDRRRIITYTYHPQDWEPRREISVAQGMPTVRIYSKASVGAEP